jgi:hypothetical protein
MRGTTLVELVVALLVLGLGSGIAALALGGLRPPPPDPWREAVGRARSAALREGRAVPVHGDSGRSALLLPDGRALGPGLDPLTGEVRSATR